jgi:hypothetical protein
MARHFWCDCDGAYVKAVARNLARRFVDIVPPLACERRRRRALSRPRSPLPAFVFGLRVKDGGDQGDDFLPHVVLKDELLDARLLRAVGMAPYDEADMGECQATRSRSKGPI